MTQPLAIGTRVRTLYLHSEPGVVTRWPAGTAADIRYRKARGEYCVCAETGWHPVKFANGHVALIHRDMLAVANS